MKVSVIMPVYNGEKTLPYAIASLVRQTHTDWECVIVDDGSTDGTRDLLDGLADPRFKVYHLDRNCGRAVARDEALEHADGEYLAYLDADDMMHEDKFARQVEYLETHPDARLVSCNCIYVSESLEPHSVSFAPEVERSGVFKYGDKLPICLPTSMLRLKLAKQFAYDHFLDVGEDYDYLSRYLDGGRYGNLARPMYYYMIGADTYRKVMYYQWNSLRGGIVKIKNGLVRKGVKHIISRFAKLLVYAVAIPFFGINTVVEKRNNSFEVSADLFAEYKNQLSQIHS